MRTLQITAYLLSSLHVTALGHYDRFPRDIVSSGGFAIRTNSCDDSQSFCLTTVAGFDVCCPSSLNCLGGSNDRCCPTENDCLSELQTSPQCADTSWNLCGGTTGYFCCLVGTTCYGLVVNGVNAVGCLPAGEVLTAGQTAIGTVLAGVTPSTSSPTSTTPITTASTTGSTSTSATPSPTGSSSDSSGGRSFNAVQTAFSILGPIVGIAALAFAIYAYKRNKNRKQPGSAVISSTTGGTAPRNRMEYDNVFELDQNGRRPPPGFNYGPVNSNDDGERRHFWDRRS